MKLLLLFLLLPFNVFCQNTIGLPDVVNYPKQVYSAGLQNWDFTQDKNGILYVANNEGLLSYDGKYWNLYSLPNKTIVRSVGIGKDNRIYVGGQDELGYFFPGKNGQLQYFSLTRLIEAKDKLFNDVWDVVSFGKDIYFRSNNKIFRFSSERITTFDAPGEWAYMGICDNQLYAHDYKMGLMQFKHNSWLAVTGNNQLPVNDPVTSMLPMKNKSALITTLKNGLYIFSGSSISSMPTVNNQLFRNERIYAATAVNAEWIALATSNNGIYIVDLQGNIIQRFSKTEGLQNNNVLSIFLDSQKNLWLGLDNGIDLISHNSAIKQINPLLHDGSGYTAIIDDSRLFLGTSNGLYSVWLKPASDMSFSRGDFVPVQNAKGQTWGLAKINNQLLLGQHEGAFVIKDNAAKPIASNTGYWNFIAHTNGSGATQIIAGNYKGLSVFDFINQQFIPSTPVPDFIESSRFVVVDAAKNIWVSHPYHGIFKLNKSEEGKYITTVFTDKDGLPSNLNNHIYKIKNEVIVATEKGLYNYNLQQDKFEQSSYYQHLLGNQSIRYVKEDNAGNIWFIHEKTLGVIDLSGKEPVIIYLPELNNKMLSGFEFIYPVDDRNIFLGAERGFFHINYQKYKKSVPALLVQIRSVRIISKTDSVLFGGYPHVEGQQLQDMNDIPVVSHSWKTIRFEFASPFFGYQSNLEYSFRLKGFDESWSPWTRRTEKEYTNLPARNYSFEVKVRNNLGNESAVASYSFKMLPPWYSTLWANLSYVILLSISLFALYRWLKKKFELQQSKFEQEQKRLYYIHDLELSKTESELIALRNEKLEVEINFKNSELASSAMHLVKKGELLTKMKAELSQLMKGFNNPAAVADLKKMIRSLSEDDNLDKEWVNFTKHFDRVHSDFVINLKEKHPTITNNELKLCAYLRMNLSTKEIAQLMNISVRGVEISRYRLRKKLQLPTDATFFNYLIAIQK